MSKLHDKVEDAVLTDWAEAFLHAKGATVTWPGETLNYMRPVEFYRSLPDESRPPIAAFYFRLRAAGCPAYRKRLSPTGRLLELSPTPALIAFVTTKPHPGGPAK